jgi:YHS domain-containing protein
MTAARQQRKRRIVLLVTACLAVLGATLAAWPPAGAGTSERVVADRHSGLAISGFDPVAYFADRAPVPGRIELEYAFGGAIWRFRNEGNRAAFVAHPETYMPQFGGYDPVGVARGVAVAGNPDYWAVAGGQLWLFYSEAGRQAFLADPDRIIAAAAKKWPEVVHSLVR